MAAYAALVSVMHIIEQIQHHPRPPISLDEDQVQSLTQKVTFLQEFLEVYSHVRNEEADRLQSRIADAAYAAEDVIEAHIVDQILEQSKTQGERISSTADFFQDLQKVIRDIDLVMKEVVEIEEKMGSANDIQLQTTISVPKAGSSRSHPKGQNIMVGFDDVLIQLMDKLTGKQFNCQIIPIVGMGGIGKTTLAINAYENPFIVQYFDIRAWVTVSQEYSTKEILLEILSCQENQEKKENLRMKSADELGEVLYKSLCGRRYLIIMDDMWSIQVWDNVKIFFPNNNSESRVIITTRLSNLAQHLPSASSLELSFLNEELSWNLLSKIVFGEDGCPLKLEEIGKKIAQNCKGLPLSIVVIGGLLAKSKQTKEYWNNIAKNLNSIVNLEDNERCLKLLHLSYNQLPVHLKPCFLYMGVFPEDTEIRVSSLIKLWVVEGFLKPIIGKSLEDAAEEYLNDLINRNLILILRRKYNGKIKFCKIHDLLRDLCLREGHRERFVCVTKLHGLNDFPQATVTERRIAIHRGTPQIHDGSPSPSLARSLICDSVEGSSSLNFRLLRVLKAYANHSLEYTFLRGVNLRYFAVPNHYRGTGIDADVPRIPSSVYLLWNLQTLIDSCSVFAIEIWKMPLLRHVEFHALLLPSPSGDFSSHCLGMFGEQNDFVLENLQTLSNVVNLRCNEKIVRMIPNIKKLRILYTEEFEGSYYCLNNLGRLHKLESLNLNFHQWAKQSRSDLMQNLSFPHSLKKLSLEGCNLNWEDISINIGALPLLQVLKVRRHSFVGCEWETVEGQFFSLKILQIEDCDLKYWTTDNTHFPCLEHLVLKGLYELEEIPLDIAKIPTLQSIELEYCSRSAVYSAKEIAEEQENLAAGSLQVRVICWDENQELANLASHNFHVRSIITVITPRSRRREASVTQFPTFRYSIHFVT